MCSFTNFFVILRECKWAFQLYTLLDRWQLATVTMAWFCCCYAVHTKTGAEPVAMGQGISIITIYINHLIDYLTVY